MINQRRGIDPSGSAAFLADREQLPIRLDHRSDDSALLGLARIHRLTVYDAAYLELAVRLQAPLAALGRKLAAAASTAGVSLVGT